MILIFVYCLLSLIVFSKTVLLYNAGWLWTCSLFAFWVRGIQAKVFCLFLRQESHCVALACLELLCGPGWRQIRRAPLAFVFLSDGIKGIHHHTQPVSSFASKQKKQIIDSLKHKWQLSQQSRLASTHVISLGTAIVLRCWVTLYYSCRTTLLSDFPIP